MKRVIVVSVTIIVNIILDQVSKVIARNNIGDRETIEVIGDYFILIKIENKGAFLGMLSDLPENIRTIVLSILPAIAIIWFTIHTIRDKRMNMPTVVGVSFMLGGGIGNLYDRIVYGSVTDFMHIDLGFTQTGIFNVADVSIMTGGFLVLIQFFKSNFGKKKEKAETDSVSEDSQETV